MPIRPIILATDLPTLRSWWSAHKALEVPEFMLEGADGFMVHDGGVEIAACFAYLGLNTRFAVVEFITTNPRVAQSKASLRAVYELLAHVEAFAKARGALALFSFVAPGTGEERIMDKIGYVTSQGVGHRMWGKQLVSKEGT